MTSSEMCLHFGIFSFRNMKPYSDYLISFKLEVSKLEGNPIVGWSNNLPYAVLVPGVGVGVLWGGDVPL